MEKNKLTVLLIDDDFVDAEIMRRYLEEINEWQIEFLHLLDSSECNDEVINKVDILFIDYFLGAETGLDLLKKIFSSGFIKPVIMLTGQGDEEIAVEAMKSGASDYLVKGKLSPDNLRYTIINTLEKYRLKLKIQEQQKALLDAERQRVMMESLGAASHHMSQPLTAISGNLQLLRMNPNLDPEQKKFIEESFPLIEKMHEIINKLREIREYRTTPYVNEYNILDIGL